MAKPYKCRVEYLESTGGQWIDIGVGVKSNTIAKAIFSIASTATGRSYFGARNSSNERFQIVNSFGVGNGYFYNANIYPIANQKYEIEMHANGDVYLDGVKRNATNGTFSPVAFDRSLYIFSTNYYDDSGVPSASTFWKVQILEGDTLVRDMIPVLDLSGRPAMYDQVSGKLFYNQGTGEFTYGRQIIPVEYLESTGTQYIDTGIKFDCANTKIELKTYEDSLTRIHSICGDDGNIFYYFRGTGNWAVGYNATASNIDSSMVAGDNVFVIDKNNVYLNGVLAKTYTASSTVSSYNALLFNRKTSLVDKGAVTMYYCKIWDNNTLVRDFIPCMDENHVPFMFDLVNCTVYLNAGTGQFKVGPNVEKVWGGKKLRRKLALALANLKKPRKYYCEVEYLENTSGNYAESGSGASENVGSYINTGIHPKPNGIVKMGLSLNSGGINPYQCLFGGYDENTRNFGVVIQDNKTYFMDGSQANDSDTWTRNLYYDIEFDASQKKLIKNGESKTYSGVTGLSTESNLSIYLFTDNSVGGSMGQYDTTYTLMGKIYYFRYYEGDTLVCDMIPVLDWDMTPCMYDKVTGQFFYNQGTGNFTYGREIHYVDYLGSTGTQYINTGLLSTASSTVDTEFSFTSMESGVANNVGVFGGRNYTTTNTFTFFKIASGNPQYFRFDYNSQTTVGTETEMTWNTASKYRFQYNGTNCITTNTTTGESVITPRSPASTFTTNPICLFAVNTGGAIGQYLSGRIYYYKYSDGTKSVDMVPAIDSEGRGFMLDRVSHTIYDNAGTGAFKYPAREVEYLESDGARAIVAGVTVDDTSGYDVKWMALNANDTIIMGTKGSGDSRWVLSGNNNPNVNISWNTSYGSVGLGLNKIQTAQMNYFNDRKRILNDTPLTDITQTLSANASTYSVGIFGGYWGASQISLYSTCRIYYAKISKGTELIRDFIPMVKDGSPCLFDKIGGLYYFGTGTGTFTTGKIVEPEYE